MDPPHTWDSLRAALAGSLQLGAERPRGFSATMADGYPLSIEHAPGDVVSWLIVRAPVCKQEEMDPQLVLERNGTLAFATLLLMQGAYWLRVAVPFDSAELRDPIRLVTLCVDAAKSLSPHRVEPVAGASAIFAHYVD